MSDSDNKDKNVVAAVGDGDYTSLITIDSITDNTGTQQGPVSNGGMTDDLQPTLSGYVPYADSGGLIVRVYLNSVPVGSAVVQPGGQWTFTPDTPLAADTSNYFQVVLLDPGSGSQLRFSDPYYVNTTAPDQDTPINVALDNVSDNVQGGITGTLVNGDVTNDARPDLSGHATAGATVNVYDNNVLIGSTTAAADGSWAFTPADNLADGAHNLSVTAVSTTGESASTDGFTLTVDTQIAAPELTAIVDNVGDYQSDVLNDGKTDDKQPLLTGTGEPGSHIAITMYGPQTHKVHTIGTVTVGEDGTWSYQFTGRKALQSGDNVFHITGTDAAGNTLAGEDFTVQLTGSNQDSNDNIAPDAPFILQAIDDMGGTSYIQSGGSTDDNTPTLNGTAEASSLVTVTDNGAVIGSVIANSNGQWSFTPAERNEGRHAFSVTATDTAGNTSGNSDDFVVSIDVPDDITFSITGVIDNTGLQQGNLLDTYSASNIPTDDITPTLTGTAESGSVIKFYTAAYIEGDENNGEPLGSTTANSSGQWTFTTKPILPGGDVPISIECTSPSGNVSQDGVFLVIHPNGIPGNITFGITGVIDNTGLQQGNLLDTYSASKIPTDDTTPTLTGTAEPGSVINFYSAAAGVDGSGTEPFGSTTAGSSGQWTFTTPLLPAGDVPILVKGISPSGHESLDLVYLDIQPNTSMLYSATNVSEHHELLTLAQVDDLHNSSAVADTTDHSQNTLQLTLNDILNDAHDNLFIQDGNKQLAVTGDAGDVVELKVEDLAQNTWQDAGQVTAGGVQYEVYQHAGSNVELLVQQGVELHQVS